MEPVIWTSAATVIGFEAGYPVASNFLTRTNTFTGEVGIAILRICSSPMNVYQVFAALGTAYLSSVVAVELLSLLDAQLIVVAGTDAAATDLRYRTEWAWGATAGTYRFGIRDPIYMDADATINSIAIRAELSPSPPLVERNEESDQTIRLRPTKDSAELFRTMKRRRSFRGFSEEPITLEQLSDCLFAGLGILGFIRTSIPGEGLLPLKMTPSGGARNPYEGYVYARRVAALAPGLYHYDGVSLSLQRRVTTIAPHVSALLAEQPWFEEAAVLILLVANYRRTMWKYPHPTGYRVVLIEAGHIAQNMLLAATYHGLASAPTCAVADSLNDVFLGLDSITQSVVYAVALGQKSSQHTIADAPDILVNPAAGSL